LRRSYERDCKQVIINDNSDILSHNLPKWATSKEVDVLFEVLEVQSIVETPLQVRLQLNLMKGDVLVSHAMPFGKHASGDLVGIFVGRQAVRGEETPNRRPAHRPKGRPPVLELLRWGHFGLRIRPRSQISVITALGDGMKALIGGQADAAEALVLLEDDTVVPVEEIGHLKRTESPLCIDKH